MLDLHSRRFGFGPESSCAVCVTELIKPGDGKNRIHLPYDLFVMIEIVHSRWTSPALFLLFFSCGSAVRVAFKSQEGRAANESAGISWSDDRGWRHSSV